MSVKKSGHPNFFERLNVEVVNADGPDDVRHGVDDVRIDVNDDQDDVDDDKNVTKSWGTQLLAGSSAGSSS